MNKTNTNTQKLGTTMTEERKKEYIKLFDKMLDWAMEPEKSLERLESYKKRYHLKKQKIVIGCVNVFMRFQGTHHQVILYHKTT